MLILLSQHLRAFKEHFQIAGIHAVNLAISTKLLWIVSRPVAMAATEHFLQPSLERLEQVRAQFFLHFVNVEALMLVTVHRNWPETESVRKRVHGSKNSRWNYTAHRDREQWRH
jgi:hypothetical protein